MDKTYRVTIHGRILEGRSIRELLALAVFEKRNMDRKIRFGVRLQAPELVGHTAKSGGGN